MAKDLYKRQRQEFRSRRDLLLEKTNKMYTNYEGFKDFYAATWEEYSDRQKHEFLEKCRKSLEDACPTPKYKYISIMGLSCPEFFNDELVKGKVKLMEFMEFVLNRQENDKVKYPWVQSIEDNLIKFLENTGWNIYEDFQDSPKRKEYTEILCWEQRSMWCAHFALCTVADICGELAKSADLEKRAAQGGVIQEENKIEEVSKGEDDQAEADKVKGCNYCGKLGKMLRCTKCKKARYCCRDCQRNAWPTHKQECN